MIVKKDLPPNRKTGSKTSRQATKFAPGSKSAKPTPPVTEVVPPELEALANRTQLGRELLNIRKQMIAAGIPSVASWEEVDTLLDRRSRDF